MFILSISANLLDAECACLFFLCALVRVIRFLQWELSDFVRMNATAVMEEVSAWHELV